MSRSAVGAIGVGALLFVVQHVVFREFTVLGVHPELLLLFSICCGLAGGTHYGVVAGFVAGLVSDAFLVSPMGLSAFAFGIAGYLAGVVADDAAATPSVTALASAATTALGLILVFVLGRIFGSVHVSFGHAIAVIFVAAFVNAVLAVPVRRILRVIRASDREFAW